MKRQVAKVINYGTWRVIHDDTKTVNPYRITMNGRKVADYQNLTSCLWHLTRLVSYTECQ